MKNITAILTIFLSFSIIQQVDAMHSELPSSVVIGLAHRYGHFDLIHTAMTRHRGRLAFDLVLQHGSSYLSVTVGNQGHFYGEAYHRYYPLDNHYCDDHCSFQYMHYGDGHFADYDPYYGCHVHVNLMIHRYPRFHYQPYYGYRYVYYHPKIGTYKRFRHYQNPSREYDVLRHGHKSNRYHKRTDHHKVQYFGRHENSIYGGHKSKHSHQGRHRHRG